MNSFEYQPLLDARARLMPHLPLPTPLIKAQLKGAGAVYLKVETFLPTGSFKVRPALNGILSQLDHCRQNGVLTSSSGNFAQAVAWAASRLGCRAKIVMTRTTSEYKIRRTRELGADVVLCGSSFEERWETTFSLQRGTGNILLHPYNSPETIHGNGTIGLELQEQLAAIPETDITVLAPVSGGGLLAGIACALKTSPGGAKRYRVLGVQQKVNGSLQRALSAGKPTKVQPFTSIADALVALEPGDLAFEVINKYQDGALLVDESEILRASRDLLDEQKLLVEPAGAIGVAALSSGIWNPPPGHAVVCVLSGGNVPVQRLL